MFQESCCPVRVHFHLHGRRDLLEPLALLPLKRVVREQRLAEVGFYGIEDSPEKAPFGLVCCPGVGQVGHHVGLVAHPLPEPLLAELGPEGDLHIAHVALAKHALLIPGDLG